MGVLIDTDVLIDLERRRRTGFDLPPGEDLYISVVTAAELLEGVERAAPPERIWRRLFTEELFDLTEPIPITLPVARLWSSFGALLGSQGRRIGSEDLWIAATAVAYDLPLMTRNLDEFSRVPGLRLVEA